MTKPSCLVYKEVFSSQHSGGWGVGGMGQMQGGVRGVRGLWHNAKASRAPVDIKNEYPGAPRISDVHISFKLGLQSF